MRYTYRNFMLFFFIAVITLSSIGCAHKATTQADATPPSSVIAPKEAAPVPQAVQSPDIARNTEGAVAADSVATTPADSEMQDAVAGARLPAALQAIYFNFDAATLGTDARETLAGNFRQLSDAKVKVQIEGHCDERGSGDYNLALGERRADAARKYLIALGMSEDRISIISYGKEKPAVEGSDEAAWSKNRRAEFVIQK